MGCRLTVRPLVAADGPVLAAMLGRQSADYMRYFTPFAFDAETVTDLLMRATDDLYTGLFVDDDLAGFFMLRGWDDGYAVPAYGVTIDEAFRGRGFAALTLDLAKVVSRLRGAEHVMLKVHPENVVAKRLYERAGFVETGVDPRNQNLVLRVAL